MRIYLTDNNLGQSGIARYYRKDVAALFPIAGKNIAQLCRENENLLIFPYCLNDTDDRIGESSVIDLQNTDDAEKWRLSLVISWDSLVQETCRLRLNQDLIKVERIFSTLYVAEGSLV